jgi:hypothetical protein
MDLEVAVVRGTRIFLLRTVRIQEVAEVVAEGMTDTIVVVAEARGLRL